MAIATRLTPAEANSGSPFKVKELLSDVKFKEYSKKLSKKFPDFGVSQINNVIN